MSTNATHWIAADIFCAIEIIIYINPCVSSYYIVWIIQYYCIVKQEHTRQYPAAIIEIEVIIAVTGSNYWHKMRKITINLPF